MTTPDTIPNPSISMDGRPRMFTVEELAVMCGTVVPSDRILWPEDCRIVGGRVRVERVAFRDAMVVYVRPLPDGCEMALTSSGKPTP